MSNVPIIQPDLGSTETTRTLVTEKFNTSQNYAMSAYSTAMMYLGNLYTLIQNMTKVDKNITYSVLKIDTTFSMPSEPKSPSLTYDDSVIRNVFKYTENAYISSLLSQLKDKLITVLTGGGSGLGSATEDAMWQRETERNKQALQDTKDRIASDWAERGLSLPGGGLFNAFAQVDIEHLNKMNDKARTIAEETRKIEIENVRLAMQEAKNIEAILMDYAGKYWDRKLQAAKAILEEATVIFNASIEVIKTKASVYGQEVSAYAAKVQALTSKAQLTISGIKGNMDYAVAKVNAQIEVLKASIEEAKGIYTLSVESTKGQAAIAAQLAASALSAVSASAQISLGDRQSVDSNISASETWKHEAAD